LTDRGLQLLDSESETRGGKAVAGA